MEAFFTSLQYQQWQKEYTSSKAKAPEWSCHQKVKNQRQYSVNLNGLLEAHQEKDRLIQKAKQDLQKIEGHTGLLSFLKKYITQQFPAKT